VERGLYMTALRDRQHRPSDRPCPSTRPRIKPGRADVGVAGGGL